MASPVLLEQNWVLCSSLNSKFGFLFFSIRVTTTKMDSKSGEETSDGRVKRCWRPATRLKREPIIKNVPCDENEIGFAMRVTWIMILYQMLIWNQEARLWNCVNDAMKWKDKKTKNEEDLNANPNELTSASNDGQRAIDVTTGKTKTVTK